MEDEEKQKMFESFALVQEFYVVNQLISAGYLHRVFPQDFVTTPSWMPNPAG